MRCLSSYFMSSFSRLSNFALNCRWLPDRRHIVVIFRSVVVVVVSRLQLKNATKGQLSSVASSLLNGCLDAQSINARLVGTRDWSAQYAWPVSGVARVSWYSLTAMCQACFDTPLCSSQGRVLMLGPHGSLPSLAAPSNGYVWRDSFSASPERRA
jgi:hypothetical protein